MVWPSIISGAFGLAGSMFGGGGQKPSRSQAETQLRLQLQNFANQREAMDAQERWNQRSEELARNAISIRAADARAAGLHPLFALGAPGVSAQFNTGGPSPVYGGDSSGYMPQTGSALGQGLAAAGRAVEGWADRRAAKQELEAMRGLRQAQVRAQNASALRDEMSAAEIASRIKRAEQDVLVKRPSGDGVELRPYDFGPTTAFGRRPTQEFPRQSHPGRYEMVDPDGRRRYVLNPDLGMDEVGQVDYVWQRVQEEIAKFLNWHADNPGTRWFARRLNKSPRWERR